MALIKHHKIVSALPAQLEANAMYFVRKDAGFEVHLTNSTGIVVAYPANYVTNADARMTKLDGIQAGAQVNTVTSVAGRTGAVVLDKADVRLDNVDNTSDVNKPVSTAQQTALDLKVDKVTGKGLSTNDLTAALLAKLNAAAPLDSPPLTGNPTAPTPAAEDADTSIATTAFVRAAMALFGVGSDVKSLITPDLNANLASGLYYANSPVNAPDGLNGWLIQLRLTPGVYATQLYVAFGNPQRAFFRTQVDATIWTTWQEIWHTGNLVKQTSTTDTTPGALMAVGAFGLGAQSVALGPTDANTLNNNGTYYSVSWTNGWRGYGHLQHINQSSSYAIQIFYGATVESKGLAFRLCEGGVWGGWEPIYHTGNILGTVSQLNGVPTGAIIERGSNANGEYVRFADGTQICTRRASDPAAVFITFGSVGIWNANQSWIFPTPFSSAPRVSVTGANAEAVFLWGTSNTPTATGVLWRLYSAITGTLSVSADLIAIGRWY